MNNKKVSVIIPFYNGVEWLFESVDSVLKQTYDNIEIIVINDGSKEDVGKFLDKYGSKIIYHYQENQGVAVARNNGISIATGDYIAFLDSDDIWLPDKLELQIQFMQKSGAKWSHTGFYYWFPESEKLQVINNYVYYGDVRKQFYVTMKVATPSVVIEKLVFDTNPEIRFPPEFKKGQDTQLYRALANKYPLALIQKPLVKVRMREDNSYRQAYARFRTNALAFNMYKNSKNTPWLAKVIMGYYAKCYTLLGSEYSPSKEKAAKLLWIIPYIVERIYSKYLNSRAYKDHKYILIE